MQELDTPTSLYGTLQCKVLGKLIGKIFVPFVPVNLMKIKNVQTFVCLLETFKKPEL